MTNTHIGMRCNTCAQNTPTHPAGQPPINSTIPAGGEFTITSPNKLGAWDFRSFTFSPDHIVVNQGDKVTLDFIGVQVVAFSHINNKSGEAAADGANATVSNAILIEHPIDIANAAIYLVRLCRTF